ncbi:hypothetical protein PGT21_008949 [Puccinia graminis f. sp. tritici]|uniref:RNase H type-1 domain-containing protein n=1 Tax=Puccinia graminis f. sp. tritici TaxID=56615 RepID=A0A5B0PCC5_PUCGR|nr:hypothetical protein PGT21_008949 [Puccinia graminis f. sp. tritici]
MPRVLNGVQTWYTNQNKAKITDLLNLINNQAAQFTTGAAKSNSIEYLQKLQPFEHIRTAAQNRIANFWLIKLTRSGTSPTQLELQLCQDCVGGAGCFPDPAGANIVKDKLKALPTNELEQISFYLPAFPPWASTKLFDTRIDKGSKEEVAQIINAELESTPGSDLFIFTDGSAHPKKGLGAAATTADGTFSEIASLGSSKEA